MYQKLDLLKYVLAFCIIIRQSINKFNDKVLNQKAYFIEVK